MALELTKRKHNISVHEINDPGEMTEFAQDAELHLILCPFLTKHVSEEVFSNPRIPCWIVHSGIVHYMTGKMSGVNRVSILQAAEEMNPGDIWSIKTFPIKRRNINSLTKSRLYLNEVTQTAVKAVLEATDNLTDGRAPRLLDYNNPLVQGTGRPNMTKTDRTINWEMSADEVACQIRMSDSSQGALGYFRTNQGADGWGWTKSFRLFGAHLEDSDF